MCANPDEMLDKVLATAVRNLKVGGKDEEKMYDAMEAMFDKYLGKYREGFIQQGIQQGVQQEHKANMENNAQVIINMNFNEKQTKKFLKSYHYNDEDIKKCMAMVAKKRGISR